MARPVDQQICFRLADTVPAVPVSGPLRLGDAEAEALSELPQVFACGEESASFAFARLGGSPLEDAARRALLRVAGEELIHERLLRGLRGALPAPAPDRELRRALAPAEIAAGSPAVAFLLSGTDVRRLANDVTAVAGVMTSYPQGESLRVVADPLAESDLRRFAAMHAASLARAGARLEDAILAWSLPMGWH